MSTGLEIDAKLAKELQRVAERDQTEALGKDLMERIVMPMLRAISALVNQDPARARKGLHINLLVQAEPAGGEYLTTAEVADRFRVSQQQVRRWCEDGRITAERTPGGTWRIPSGQFEGIGFFVPKARRRRGVHTVAGAWKDHPELVDAALERGDRADG